MSKQFRELRERMSPEAQARAIERSKELMDEFTPEQIAELRSEYDEWLKKRRAVSIETLEQLIATWRKDTVQLLPTGVKYDGRRARLACADDLEALTRQETK